MLDNVTGYHCIRFKGKLLNQTWENSRKNKFWAWLCPVLALNWYQISFFFVDFTSTRCYALLEATIVRKVWENYSTKLEKITKNLVSCQILVPLAPKTSTRCYTLLQAIIVCNFTENWYQTWTNAKNLVSGLILARLAQIQVANFFFFFFKYGSVSL